MKRCKNCHELRPLNYYVSKRGYVCKVCKKKKRRAYRIKLNQQRREQWQQDNPLKYRFQQYVKNHYKDHVYFSARSLANDFITENNMKLTQKQRSELRRSISQQLHSLTNEKKIKKYNSKTWMLIPF